MLSLADSIQCLTLAVDNPPGRENPYLAVNQFDGAYRINDLADIFREEHGATVTHLENPRVEDDSEHRYDVEQRVLDQWGYEPTQSIEAEIRDTLAVLDDYRGRIPTDNLRPGVEWA